MKTFISILIMFICSFIAVFMICVPVILFEVLHYRGLDVLLLVFAIWAFCGLLFSLLVKALAKNIWG